MESRYARCGLLGGGTTLTTEAHTGTKHMPAAAVAEGEVRATRGAKLHVASGVTTRGAGNMTCSNVAAKNACRKDLFAHLFKGTC